MPSMLPAARPVGRPPGRATSIPARAAAAWTRSEGGGWPRRLTRLLPGVLLGLLVTGVACSSPDVSGPARALDPSQGAWALTLQAHAITMDTLAPYNTVQLVATTRNAAGAPLPDAPPPTYTTSDSSVRVSPTGVLTARTIASGVQVIATLVYQGVRLADTAVITVTGDPNPQVFAHLHLGLVNPADSTRLPTPVFQSNVYFPFRKTLLVAAEDSSGQRILGAQVALRTSAPTYATIPATTSTGTARLTFNQFSSRPGPVWVYASATVYGVTYTDSLLFTLTTPILQIYSLVSGPGGSGVTFVNGNTAVASTAVVGVSGVVWWLNTAADSMDVVFDDPSAATAAPFPATGSGDIPAFPGCAEGCDNIRARQFLRAGTYGWHSARTGVSGRVVVQ